MALKDWKKVKDAKKEILFTKDKINIAIVFGTFFKNDKKSKPWSIFIYDKNKGDEIKGGWFKTKSQALKFAKAYMRKH
jgi:fructose-specific component phosphotransferase system IIB-like protein